MDLMPLPGDADDIALDDTVKGMPPGAALTLSQVGGQGWNLLRGDLPMPAAVLRAETLRHNSAWMAEFARRNGLDLCPHGKTTMAPRLWALQLRDGAWGITVATIQQLAVARRFGVPRVILANQPVGPLAVRACFAALADCELFVLADSEAGVAALAAGANAAPAGRRLKVLLEVGVAGGRTGVRSAEEALRVAHAIAASPGLSLVGMEGFEGVLSDTQAVDAFLGGMVEMAWQVAAAGLFDADEVILSAGGTAFFDRVGLAFDAALPGHRVRRVLRSGCYLTHDSGGYAAAYQRMRAEAALDFPPGDLLPALEVWAAVQSRPEPGLAILTMGRRDISFDAGLPQPLAWHRPGSSGPPRPLPFHTVQALNDQHAYLKTPGNTPLAVGDLVCFGISHPCTTFDKWAVLLLADAGYDITGAIRTWF
jgi:D-serine dehydratase